jgi:protein pelota
VAIDTQEAAVAKVSGTHLEMIPNTYSGQSGKRYQSARKSRPNIETFFEDVAGTIQSLKKNIHTEDVSRIIIFGPGEAKRKLLNYLTAAKYRFEKGHISLVEGVDVAGEDGIYVFLRSPALKEVMSSSKLSSVYSILDEVLRLISKGENKYAIGANEVNDATAMKNIKSVIFSDAIFKNGNDEDTIMKLLDLIETNGGRLYAVDSSTDLGLRVSSLGGIVAILRYSNR